MVASVNDIDRLLPQTQCERCGYAGCRPYAEAVASGEADINRCPPGGEATIAALAALLGREAKPLDPECGEFLAPTVAVIDEDTCIGCTRCIQACPVDAIVGAAKLMHTVIGAECTGCGLCLPPCPVDCIDLVPAPMVKASQEPFDRLRTNGMTHQGVSETESETDAPDYIEALRCRHVPLTDRRAADHARQRFEARTARLTAEQEAGENRRRENRAARTAAARRNEIEAMVAAVRARRDERRP